MRARRGWFLARDRFHAWMWGGGPIRKAIIKRLPMHFSDPHYLYPERFDFRLSSSGSLEFVRHPQTTGAAARSYHVATEVGGRSLRPIVYVNGKRQG